MTTEKEQLEAEIAKRDARIAGLLADVDEWQELAARRADIVFAQNRELAALKAQPGANPEHTLFNEIRISAPVNEDGEPARYLINEQQLQRIRLLECRQPSAGVADDLRAAAENCSFVMRYIGSMEPDEIDGDSVELRFEDEDGRDTGADASIVEYAEKVADLLDAMLAAPSAQQKESGDE